MHTGVQLLVLCFIFNQAFTFDIEDTLYRCEWIKICRHEKDESGDINVVFGEKFNCYFGWLPFCILTVPKDVEHEKEFCKSLDSESVYNNKDGFRRCEVEPSKIDDDDDHFLNFIER